jgi:hypothetical protein
MAISRVRYAEKQILRAADLTAEQIYRMALRQRHVLAAHGWGIVYGLMLDQPDAAGFWLQPGLAVDGYGREIAVAEPHRHLWEPHGDPKSETFPGGALDVWLLYAESPLITPQGGSYRCGPGQHNRWGEGFTLEVESASAEAVDPWQPPDVIVADRDFASWDEPPDDPARRWPIYLGRLEIARPSFKVLSVYRPYVSLIGERVSAPSGTARMDIGAEQGGGWRFAVSLPDLNTGLLEDDRLVLDSFGRNTLRGRVVLQRTKEQADRTQEADLILPPRGAAKDFSYGFTFENPVEEPTQATPWRIYHTKVIPPEQPGQPPPPPVDQLRMELFHPEDRGNPSLSELVIGATDQMKFVPYLRIGADCSVTVYGDLNVLGSLTQGPVQADPTDPRFVNAVLDGFGRGASATQLDPTLTITINGKDPIVKKKKWDYEFDIENTGSDDLTSVVIRVDIIMPGRTASETLPALPVLPAGSKTVLFQRKITPGVEGELSLTVTVVGFGPLMRSMIKQTEKKFRIVTEAPPTDPGTTDPGTTPS